MGSIENIRGLTGSLVVGIDKLTEIWERELPEVGDRYGSYGMGGLSCLISVVQGWGVEFGKVRRFREPAIRKMVDASSSLLESMGKFQEMSYAVKREGALRATGDQIDFLVEVTEFLGRSCVDFLRNSPSYWSDDFDDEFQDWEGRFRPTFPRLRLLAGEFEWSFVEPDRFVYVGRGVDRSLSIPIDPPTPGSWWVTSKYLPLNYIQRVSWPDFWKGRLQRIWGCSGVGPEEKTRFFKPLSVYEMLLEQE